MSFKLLFIGSGVQQLLSNKRICICAGPGGVGKTTVSAAVGLAMAQQGLRVAVVTIDPAQRLANALGLKELSNYPQPLSHKRLEKHGVEISGELSAMTLNVKETFDDLITQLASSDASAERIKANRIYRQISSSVAGSQEFVAIEKLYQLDQSGDFDLIVLDTPPSRNTLDFIQAPDTLINLFSSRAMRLFLRPAGFGMRIANQGTALVLKSARYVIGTNIIEDITTFMRLINDVVEGFTERAQRVKALLGEDETAFLMVTSPQPDSLAETLFLIDQLAQTNLEFTGVVVNRTHTDSLSNAKLATAKSELTELLGASTTQAVLNAAKDHLKLARNDRKAIRRLQAVTDTNQLLKVPYFDQEIHSLEGLLKISNALSD